MAEMRTVSTLVAERDEVEAAITNYERRIDQARAALERLNAVISILHAAGDRESIRADVDIHRLFASDEHWDRNHVRRSPRDWQPVRDIMSVNGDPTSVRAKRDWFLLRSSTSCNLSYSPHVHLWRAISAKRCRVGALPIAKRQPSCKNCVMSPRRRQCPMTRFIRRVTILTHARRVRQSEQKSNRASDDHRQHGGCGDVPPPAPYGDVSEDCLDAIEKLLAPEYERGKYSYVSEPAW
jgi:hypothetical protein